MATGKSRSALSPAWRLATGRPGPRCCIRTWFYEIPQSRERIRGRDRYLRFNQEYPGDWHLRPKVVIADAQHGVVWFEWDLDGRTDDAMAFFEFADGLITRVTDFWPEPYEPPSGREHLAERW